MTAPPALSELNVMIWAALAMVLSERLHDFCFAVPTGQESTRGFVQSQIFIAPYMVLGSLRSLIPAMFRKAPEPYWVATEPGKPEERDAKARKSFLSRLLSVTLGSHGWTHLLLIMAVLGCIGYSLYDSTVAFAKGQRGLHQTALYVVMTVAWPTLPWMDLLLGSAVPFTYALVPPTVPNREKLLNREPISGKAMPYQEYKKLRPFRAGFFGQAFLTVLLVGYAVAVFTLTLIDIHVQ